MKCLLSNPIEANLCVIAKTNAVTFLMLLGFLSTIMQVHFCVKKMLRNLSSMMELLYFDIDMSAVPLNVTISLNNEPI